MIKLINSCDKVQTLSKHSKYIAISKCLNRKIFNTHVYSESEGFQIGFSYLYFSSSLCTHQQLNLLEFRSDYCNLEACELYLVRMKSHFPQYIDSTTN